MQSILRSIVFIVVFGCTFSFDVTLNSYWELWKQTNQKSYLEGEDQLRRDIWEENLKRVREHNLQADLGIYTYWLGMNKYADMTTDEFIKTMNIDKISMQKSSHRTRETFTFNPNIELPDTVDWRTKGYVTPIKDQGQFESKAAFAVTGAVEAQHFNATGKLVSLSEQNLIDCVPTTPCKDFGIDDAFEYIIKNRGIDGEYGYPYEATCQCRFDPSAIGATISKYVDIPSKDENALQYAVATIGPIAVLIDASHSSFQLYRAGVYNNPTCSETQLDHGLLVVGYGNESDIAYWIVKNSWGTSWGQQGYILMSRNRHNQCGIATMASYPLV